MWQIINQSGSLEKYYTFEPFGKTLEEGGTLTNSFMFTGQYYDSEIGEYYLRARLRPADCSIYGHRFCFNYTYRLTFYDDFVCAGCDSAYTIDLFAKFCQLLCNRVSKILGDNQDKSYPHIEDTIHLFFFDWAFFL